MSSQDSPSQIMEATEGFVADINGEKLVVNKGITRVAASHELVKRFPTRFQPVEDHLAYSDEETTTAAPGERRARAVKVTS